MILLKINIALWFSIGEFSVVLAVTLWINISKVLTDKENDDSDELIDGARNALGTRRRPGRGRGR